MKQFNFWSLSFLLVIMFISCKKSETTTDVKSKFIGTWTGKYQFTNLSSTSYGFSLIVKTDNTVVLTDSFATPPTVFNGTYTYTNDSLKITYSNSTKWNLAFQNNYTTCTGGFVGFTGQTGLVSMNKK